MNNQYRLFLAVIGEDSGQALEWRFSQHNLEFLQHQYDKGVVQSQEQNSLKLVIGNLFIHERPGISAMFDRQIDQNTLNNLFHNDSPDALDPPMASKNIHAKEWNAVLSIDEGDLIFRIDFCSDSDQYSSVSVPFSAIEDAFDTMETNYPGLEGDWVIIKPLSMALTPKLNPLADYKIQIQKVLTMKGFVKVCARSEEEAIQKASSYKGTLLFHEAEERVEAGPCIQKSRMK